MSQIKHFSYDIFDTLITRVFYKPKDLFYFLEIELKNNGEIGEDIPFQVIRMNAESDARLMSKKEEITIDEIYKVLQETTGWSNKIIHEIRDLELKFEKFGMCAIDATIKKLDSDSIIISDIYLPSNFVTKILRAKEIPYKKLFLSSEYGLTKHHSSLFKMVLKNLNIQGFQLNHIGDNKHSDIKMAKNLGIQTHHFKLTQPSRYEEGVYFQNSENGASSILAGVMKVSRLNQSYASVDDQTVWDIATNVFGPFLFLYTHWVLEKANKENISALYFMARDGYIMFQIAKIINNHLKYDIELIYLFGSRKSFHLPSITEIGAAELSWIFDKTHHLSLNSICLRIELDIEEIRSIFDENGFTEPEKNLNLKERKILKNLFMSNEMILGLIIQKANEKRNVVGQYLRQEGFQSDKSIGIVDIGWRGRQQKSLSKILHLEGLYPKEGIHGFYLSLPYPVKAFKNDKVYEYLPYIEYPELMQYHALYEIAVSADHGSCIGYEKKDKVISPILRTVKNVQILNDESNIHKRGILYFAEKAMETLSFMNIRHLENSQKISEILLFKFLKYPTIPEATAYSKICIFEDQEEEKSIELIKKLNPIELIKCLFKPSKIFNENTWREGSYIYTLKKMGFVYQKLYHKARSFNEILFYENYTSSK